MINISLFENLNTVRASYDINILIMSIIWTIGILFSILCTYIIVISKPKLIQVEFYILISFSVSTILFKIFSNLLFYLTYSSITLMDGCLFMVINSLCLTFIEEVRMIILYYSLYQVSKVSRSRFFLLLYKLTHSKRNFIIFKLATTVLAVLFTLTYLTLAYLDVHKCPSVLVIMDKFMFNFILIQFTIPCYTPIFVYTLATAYVCYSRFIQRHEINSTNNIQEMSKFRKNLKLLFNFFAMTLSFIFSASFLNLFYFLFYIHPESIAFIVIGHIGFIFYACQIIFVIYVHSILRNTSKSVISRFYS